MKAIRHNKNDLLSHNSRNVIRCRKRIITKRVVKELLRLFIHSLNHWLFQKFKNCQITKSTKKVVCQVLDFYSKLMKIGKIEGLTYQQLGGNQFDSSLGPYWSGTCTIPCQILLLLVYEGTTCGDRCEKQLSDGSSW